jgi:hypothetical protein
MSDLVERVALRNCMIDMAIGRPCRTACPPCRSNAREAIRIALEEAAKVVTEHYQELSTEHRLLLLNRAAAIRAMIKENE